MKNAVLTHLEEYSKTFDIQKYFSVMNEHADMIKNASDMDGFFKVLIEATFYSIRNFKHNEVDFNVDREFEKIKNDEEAKRQFVRTYGIISTIDSWLDYKQIYKFDKDTLDMLVSSEFKNLTYEELSALKLPYQCFAIENDLLYEEGVIIDSVIFDIVNKNNRVILTIYGFAKDDKEKAILLEVLVEKDKTLLDGIVERNLKEHRQNFIKHVMNLIMYLCQPKIEVIKKKIVKDKKGDNKETKKPKHFYKINYEENEVGISLGNAIRNYKIVYEEHVKTHKGIGTKRPHMRCGHFQGYWTGKGRTTLVTKYIEPIFVLGGNKNATLHNVKGDKITK